MSSICRKICGIGGKNNKIRAKSPLAGARAVLSCLFPYSPSSSPVSTPHSTLRVLYGVGPQNVYSITIYEWGIATYLRKRWPSHVFITSPGGCGVRLSLRAPNMSAWCFCNAWIETWHYYSTAFRLHRVHALGRRNHRRARLGRTPPLTFLLLASFNQRLDGPSAPQRIPYHGFPYLSSLLSQTVLHLFTDSYVSEEPFPCLLRISGICHELPTSRVNRPADSASECSVYPLVHRADELTSDMEFVAPLSECLDDVDVHNCYCINILGECQVY